MERAMAQGVDGSLQGGQDGLKKQECVGGKVYRYHPKHCNCSDLGVFWGGCFAPCWITNSLDLIKPVRLL